MNETNWTSNKNRVTDADKKALAKAKAMEAADTENGYKWVRLKAGLMVHVPCDENGDVTDKGRRIIESYRHAQDKY